MKYAFSPKEQELKKQLYRSNLLIDDEIVAFKTIYHLLGQQKVKDRTDRLKTHYDTIISAYNRDPKIANLFHGILRSRGIKDKYMGDIIKLYGKQDWHVQIMEKHFFEYKDNNRKIWKNT